MEFNFDESIIEWNKNKNKQKNGLYTYKKQKTCCIFKEENKRCRKKKILDSDYCELHYYS